ncbi:serine/threonine-protein kinase [Saccharopolyspora endophytica]|uniref:non-specific serine/threonine protein kinase n=1 Tax=Saccharopolyspora endophytica TaxID=543886 RepID=A0ABS5D8M8_9PSEU|nr:serine/threonine-protein kinase [Saccharopolyspora endophytica]MBQ0922639.1 serine/threonine protein kinase [Saccharopolyspora endophytica]
MSEIGTLLAGRYRLERQLGSGGMGVVWLATDELLQRPVAVKQLHATHGMDPRAADEARQRAMREGRLAARLQHPNAIAVHDVTEHDGLPVLVMEYLPSRSLADVLAEQHRMAPETVAVIGSQAVQALAAAHQAGIVHRDIKPGNVLLGDDGTVKITDFGISHAADDIAVTKTGILSGTPAYLAPEIARGNGPSPGSDIYSLGATLYAAVEGFPPSGEDAENSLALLHRVAAGATRPAEHAGPLGPVLDRMLDTSPNQRPTPEQLHAALHAAASGQPLPGEFAVPMEDRTQVIGRISGHTTTVVPPTGGHYGTRLDNTPITDWNQHPSPQRSTRPTRRPLLIAGLAAVAILLITLGIAQLSSEAPKPSADTRMASPADLERVVSDYYALLPQHPDNAWTRLGPALQTRGQQNYENAWSQISDVVVFSAPATTGNDTVHVGIELTKPDGTRIKEFHQLGLLVEDGAPLINTDTVLHSETVTPPPPPPPPAPTKTKEQEGKGEEEKKGEEDKKGEDD